MTQKTSGKKAISSGASARPQKTERVKDGDLMSKRSGLKSVFKEDVLYSIPVHNSPDEQRGIITKSVRGEPIYQIVRTRPEVPDRPAEVELAFTFEEVDEISKAVLSGDPSVLKEPGLARKLAAVCRFALYDADYKLMRPHKDHPISVVVRGGGA